MRQGNHLLKKIKAILLAFSFLPLWSLGCSKEQLCPPTLAILSSRKKPLVNNTVTIEGVQFDKKGNFLNEAAVALFLENAYKEGKLPLSAFKSASCFKVTDYAQAKGLQTRQLFIIESKCDAQLARYILKDLAVHYQGARHLAHFYTIKEFEALIGPHMPPYPSLIIPVVFLKYGQHYMGLMPYASGRSLATFMEDYVKMNTPEAKKRVIKAYREVGKTLSIFHQLFMPNKGENGLEKTVIQGDFHHLNIFYDPSTKHVSFIDNEHMVPCLKHLKNPLKDIESLLSSVCFPHLIPRDIQETINIQKWLELMLPSFLLAYVKHYPSSQQEKVLHEIEKRLSEGKYKNVYKGYELKLLFKKMRKFLLTRKENNEK